MIYVTSIDKTVTEPIYLVSDFKMRQLIDGTLTVSFKCYPHASNPGYSILKSECYINVDGYDFKVKQFKNGETYKDISATSTFFELSKIRKNDILGGTTTLSNRVSFCLSNTGWTATFDSDVENHQALIANFGNSNIINLINTIKSAYDVEYSIERYNVIHFSRRIGGTSDHQYRYNYNVSDVILTEDTTNMYTVIRGTGANGLTAVYRSPNADIFGELEAEPVVNEELGTYEALAAWLPTQIEDFPKVSISSTVSEMLNRKTGEYVWLIYEPLDIEISTRVTEQTKTIIDNELVTTNVILGNVIAQSFTDLMVQQSVKIDENNKATISRFEQTNEYILLEVERIDESIGSILITADEIRQSVTDLETDMYAQLTITANAIRTEVNTGLQELEEDITAAYQSSIEQSATNILATVQGLVVDINEDIQTVETSLTSIQQTTNSIQSTVSSQQTTITNQGARLSTAESRITQNANSINLKVDKNGVISAINLTSESATISAAKINFQGQVFGQGSTWSGDIETSQSIKVGTNIQLGESYSSGKMLQFSSAATISNMNSAAGLEVSATEFSTYDVGYVIIGGPYSDTAYYGTHDFSSATVTGLSANTVGPFSFAYTTTGQLDVLRFGTKIGSVKFI